MSTPTIRPIRQRQAFTLIELLMVIAIIGLLSAILFPVFGRAREKSRQSVCLSNVKSMLSALTMYTNDNDGALPLSVSGSAQVGSVAAAANGWLEFGIHDELQTYVKNKQIFACPSDNAFTAGTVVKVGGVTILDDNTKVWQENGTSYKFNKNSFSQPPKSWSAAQITPVPTRGTAVYDQQGNGDKVGPGYTLDAPFPMLEAFFQRPAETPMVRCYEAPWDTPSSDGNRAVMHDSGMVAGFADGHAKWIISDFAYKSFCDGPTWSPVRNVGQPNFNANGDGSCGGERKTK